MGLRELKPDRAVAGFGETHLLLTERRPADPLDERDQPRVDTGQVFDGELAVVASVALDRLFDTCSGLRPARVAPRGVGRSLVLQCVTAGEQPVDDAFESREGG